MQTQTQTPWTDQRQRQLRAEGLSDAQIAHAIRARAGWDDKREDSLRNLWSDGFSASQIAAELGVTRNAVMGKVHRLGLSGRAKSARSAAPRKRPGLGRRIAAPRQRPMPPPVPIVDAEIPLAQRRAFLDLNGDSCRWPVGNPGTAGFFFCGGRGADLTAGRPYCPGHAVRAFSGVSVRRC